VWGCYSCVLEDGQFRVMNTKFRLMWYAAVALLSGVVSYVVFVNPGGARAQSGAVPITVRPFVAELRVDYYPPSGKLVRTQLLTYGRYADAGHVMRQTQSYPVARELMGEVFDMQHEVKIFLDPRTKSKMTMAFPRAEQISFRAGLWEENCPARNEVTEWTPADDMLGYKTVRVTKKFGPSWTTERWMIPMLNCFTVREVDMASSARTERTALKITEGEPDSAMIDALTSYTERSPAIVEGLFKNVTGEDSFMGSKLAASMEAEYRRRNAK